MNKLLAGFSLGANLAFGRLPPADTVRAAIDRLGSLDRLRDVSVSPLYQTPAFPPGSGPAFVNAALVARIDAAPSEAAALAARLLADCHAIEADFGRERLRRWGGRTLDIDLVFLSDLVCPDALTQTTWRGLDMQDQATKAPTQLVLPHPRLQDRAFVLVPLAGLLPDWRHPLLGLTLQEMLDCLPQALRDEVKPI